MLFILKIAAPWRKPIYFDVKVLAVLLGMKDGMGERSSWNMGKCSVPLFLVNVGQYLLPENHSSKCPGNVWITN